MTINLRTREGWDDLKRILDDRPNDVLRICALKVKASKGTILIDDPRGQGRDNFAIWCKSDGLSWKNFTNDEYRGRSLELIAYCQGWFHLPKRGADEAARFAIERLGLGEVDGEQLARDRAAAAQRRAVQAEDATREARRARVAAFNTFINAQTIIGREGLGTGAETYLREARGIDLRAAPFIGPRGGPRVPLALRFIPSHKYVVRNKDGEKVREDFYPCMIAACVDRNMKIGAIHQTWLRPDFSDKADIPPAPDGQKQKPRKVWPASTGLVIPLWRGDGHLTPREAEELGLLQTLAFGEGVEDSLTEVLAQPANRTWAMISLSNMVHVADRLPACCDSVIVHRQNDWQKPEAVAQFDRGMAAFRATGRAVAEVAAVIGKDLNDTLRGAA